MPEHKGQVLLLPLRGTRKLTPLSLQAEELTPAVPQEQSPAPGQFSEASWFIQHILSLSYDWQHRSQFQTRSPGSVPRVQVCFLLPECLLLVLYFGISSSGKQHTSYIYLFHPLPPLRPPTEDYVTRLHKFTRRIWASLTTEEKTGWQRVKCRHQCISGLQ